MRKEKLGCILHLPKDGQTIPVLVDQWKPISEARSLRQRHRDELNAGHSQIYSSGQ